MAFYLAALLIFNVGYNVVVAHNPKVLGFARNINQAEIIRLTNVERSKVGAPAVVENSLLNQAAALKAQNMFAEDYWAHYSPSGKSPWYWFDQVGYAYILAGENLARDFDTSQGVINGWMNSTSHRENMLTPGYKHIGIAVVNGIMSGHETTLVVQLFGTQAAAKNTAPPPTGGSTGSSQPAVQSQVNQPVPPVNEQVNEQPIVEEKTNTATGGITGTPTAGVKNSWATVTYQLLNPMPISGWSVQQMVVIGLLAFLMVLFIFDYVVLHRLGVHRPNSHSLLHAGMMAIALIVVVYSTAGGIL